MTRGRDGDVASAPDTASSNSSSSSSLVADVTAAARDGLVVQQTSSLTSPSPSPSSPSTSLAAVAGALVPALELTAVRALPTPAHVERLFCDSVVARTVSNAQLRHFVAHCVMPRDIALLQAAVRGAEHGGLRLNAPTYELLVDKLLAAGQVQHAFALFRDMLDTLHMRPTAQTFVMLMRHCMQCRAYTACASLYTQARRVGVQPTAQMYALHIASCAAPVPSLWSAAAATFDEVVTRHPHMVSTDVYEEMLRAHLNKRPCDWRAVHACYCQMRRSTSPVVPLRWSTYLLVHEALRRGRVDWVTRVIVYVEAWAVVTPIRSVAFVKMLLICGTALFLFRAVVGGVGAYIMYRIATRHIY